jgi:hypothetical protein
MSDNRSIDEVWLPVIGRSLAYLCLDKAQRTKPDAFAGILEKVKFLEDLGVPEGDAASAVGSNLASVRVMKGRKKGTRGGKAKRK